MFTEENAIAFIQVRRAAPRLRSLREHYASDRAPKVSKFNKKGR